MTPTVRYNNRKQVLKDRKELKIEMWKYRVLIFPICFVLGGLIVYGLFHMIGYIYALITGNV